MLKAFGERNIRDLTLGGAIIILAKLKKSPYLSPREARKRMAQSGGKGFGAYTKSVERYMLIEQLTKAIGEATSRASSTQIPPSSIVGSTTTAVKKASGGCIIAEVFT